MQAGHLYEVISIQQKQVVRGSDFNDEQVTWVAFATNIRANQTDKAGVESVVQGVRVMTRTVEIMIRWRPGVTTDMRVLQSDGRIFQILDVTEIPRKRGLSITCLEYSV